MPDETPPLDIPALLEQSHPPAHRGWFWYGAGVFLLVVMISAYINGKWPQMTGLVNLISVAALLALMAVMSTITFIAVKKQRAEQQHLEAAEELIKLRRWTEAADLLQRWLSSPMRTHTNRVRALIYLTSVMARYHRFADAVAIEDYLLENIQLDPATEYGLRVGRAMAILRQDHLVDADRAISELRRMVGDQESAGLALVEMYRDIKTGHSAEAIEIFTAKLKAMRQQLDHRVSDAYALAARAHDLLGNEPAARSCWESATLLSPVSELLRRYPEVNALSERFPGVPVPAEAA